jgi:hypothetical protein
MLLTPLLVVALGLAQTASDTIVVRGTVFDSLAARPISGASVQLVSADSDRAAAAFSAVSDSAGRFTIRGLPSGRYVAGFYHPMLDSLGLELTDRVVELAAANATLSLATPSPRTVIRGFCGDSTKGVPATLLFGHVLEARTALRVAGADVTATWDEAQLSASRVDIVERTGQTVTHGAGLFALCGLPSGAPLSLRVARANESSVVDVRIPSNGVLHVTISIGAAGNFGRIIGHVADRVRKRAVPGARATWGDRHATADGAGRLVLDSVPTGTRSLEVRAIGYTPVSLLVDVAEGTATNVDVSLTRVVVLAGMTSRDSVAAAHTAQYLFDKRSDALGNRFIEPTRLEGYPSTQSVCALVTLVTGQSWCGVQCDAFFVNGSYTMLHFDDIEPDDIIGVEFLRKPPSRLNTKLLPEPCPVLVWTRCSGSAIPTCGRNPASSAIRRPDEVTSHGR